MTIYIFRLILILILLLTGCSTDISTSDLPTCTQTDCNCSDFTIQEEAQRVLDAFPDDRYKLDRVKVYSITTISPMFAQSRKT
ncbi:MAG: hypothetical protein QNJ72_41980 [Pleurocapsa sp. MO_226.B13]|nr:hypothetical protein [Pleurocapsa sp. MO_226.B13]